MAIFTTDNTILAKSPYIYAAEGNPILTTDYIIIDLYIYQGDITADRPASPTISIRKDAIDGRRVVVEVSNIIESYFGSGSSYVESKEKIPCKVVSYISKVCLHKFYIINKKHNTLNHY